MKGISKEQLIKLIEALDLEWVSITGDLKKIDASSPDGREYIHEPTGEYNITIRGFDPRPNDELKEEKE